MGLLVPEFEKIDKRTIIKLEDNGDLHNEHAPEKKKATCFNA